MGEGTLITDAVQSIKTRSPLQVFAVFAIGIILPSVFLSVLGMRSFQYENALMQKQSEEQFAAVAQLMQKDMTSQLTNWVGALRTVGREGGFDRMSPSDLIPRVVSPAPLGSVPVESLFVFDEDGRMVMPWTSGSDTESDLAARTPNWGPWSGEMARLERLEFVDKNVAEAVRGYQALQSKHLAPVLQAELLKSIASASRKLHDRRQAEAAYLRLAREFDQSPDPSGVPQGILARQLLASLYDEEGNVARALESRLDLIEGFIMKRWHLSLARREALLQDAEEAVRRRVGSGAAAERWQRLRSLQSRLEALEAGGQSFYAGVWPDLVRRILQRGWLEQGGVLTIAGTSPVPDVVVVAPILTPESGRRRGLLAARLRGQTVWPALEKILADPAQSSGLLISWDGSGSRLAKLGSGTGRLLKDGLERQVDAMDPPIQFRVARSRNEEAARLSRRRLWIYGGMVGLSLIVILVGLIVMRRAVKREMEVANLKADFVANVSHELRTPLTTISYIGERLNLGRYRTDEERQEFYGMLDKETGRLRGLIEDILDFSKMLAGKKMYHQEPLSLASLTQEAYDRFQVKAQARGFTLNMDLPAEEVTILGDRKALLQAVLNLLDNALKYSGQSNKIDVHVKRSGDRGIIAVRDYGIGIAAADQEHIFEKFYRVEQGATRDTAGGVGLGLAMVKHIVEGHRGIIRLESRPGEGSLFSIEFPLAK